MLKSSSLNKYTYLKNKMIMNSPLRVFEIEVNEGFFKADPLDLTDLHQILQRKKQFSQKNKKIKEKS